MKIEKRSLPKYVILNCITLGIYGLITNIRIGDEIDAICKGDGEEPRYKYTGAVMFRGIAPLVGIVIGLIAALAADSYLPYLSYLDYFGVSNLGTASIFFSMAAFGIIFGAIGSGISGIYHKYWWYKQANRLKLNANRYGIEIRESGTDNLVLRTVVEIFVYPLSCILLSLSVIIPALIVWIIMSARTSGAYVFVSIIVFLVSLPIMFFGMELTAGANLSMFFIFKNLSRFADVVANGAKPFDKMAYSYYPSNESVIGGFAIPVAKPEVIDDELDIHTEPLEPKGYLYGLNGSCAGYNFELTANEEFVIGKDASVSSIVIDPSFKEISRKHCGITYSNQTDGFTIIDYSSNGTWANGIKLVHNEATFFPKGTVIKLANDKNTFRLE